MSRNMKTKRNMRFKGVALLVALLTLGAVSASAQQLTMSVKEGVVECPDDLDARVYYPKTDINDEVCALLKVKPTNELKSPLILEVGGLGVEAREEKPNGEIWFYLPARVKNLTFSCRGYSDIPPIPVRMKSATVYRLTLHTDATFQTVQNAVASAAFLKMIINTEGAVVSLGRTDDYEMVCRSLEDKLFTERLNYGTYYYKVEHPLYETQSGTVEVKAGVADQYINLRPAFGYLDVTSSPSGADLFVNGKNVGKTPWKGSERYARGKVELRFNLPDYYPLRKEVVLAGNGSEEKFHFDLKPKFGTVECICDDSEAEIWIDDEYKGKGRWSGRVGSYTQHVVEARREGHKSQSIIVEVQDGENISRRIGAPVAMYGMLELMTTPELCKILVDGAPMGTTPTILTLLVGKHKLTLSAEGYQTATINVDIAHNETIALTHKLEKAVAPAPAPTSAPAKSNGYKVGDYYDDGTKQGVIFEISADGKYGKIVSLKEGYKRWASENVEKKKTEATSLTDGMANMKVIQSIRGWQEKYPAFAWCASFGEGWYLPSRDELAAISESYTAINNTLSAKGDPLAVYHWSSSEKDFQFAWYVDVKSGGSNNFSKRNNSFVRAVAVVKIGGSATASSRTYKVGDYYDDGTKQGVVFEVTDGGKHGKIVSLTEARKRWAIYDVREKTTGATSRTDGMANMRKIQSIGGWKNKYPAFAWCASLGEGWYLPARGELKTIYKAKTAINKTLSSKGETIISDNWHLSSFEFNYFCVWNVDMTDGSLGSTYKDFDDYVRAVSAF